MSDLVGNPEHRFSRVAAHMALETLVFIYLNRKNHLRLSFSIQMNSFESLKYDETSVKSTACPRSPESNISDVRETFLEETNPKRLYERAPPEGSEIQHDISYHPVYDNRLSKAEKVMKDKDLFAPFQEGKKDNVEHRQEYASEWSNYVVCF